jgi:hypothetical protein
MVQVAPTAQYQIAPSDVPSYYEYLPKQMAPVAPVRQEVVNSYPSFSAPVLPPVAQTQQVMRQAPVMAAPQQTLDNLSKGDLIKLLLNQLKKDGDLEA